MYIYRCVVCWDASGGRGAGSSERRAGAVGSATLAGVVAASAGRTYICMRMRRCIRYHAAWAAWRIRDAGSSAVAGQRRQRRAQTAVTPTVMRTCVARLSSHGTRLSAVYTRADHLQASSEVPPVQTATQ